MESGMVLLFSLLACTSKSGPSSASTTTSSDSAHTGVSASTTETTETTDTTGTTETMDTATTDCDPVGTSNTLRPPTRVCGELAPGNDTHSYWVDVDYEQTLTFTVEHDLVDVVVRVLDGSDQLALERGGDGVSVVIEAEPNRYEVQVIDDEGGGPYVLDIATDSTCDRFVDEDDHLEGPSVAQVVEVGETICANFDDQSHLYEAPYSTDSGWYEGYTPYPDWDYFLVTPDTAGTLSLVTDPPGLDVLYTEQGGTEREMESPDGVAVVAGQPYVFTLFASGHEGAYELRFELAK